MRSPDAAHASQQPQTQQAAPAAPAAPAAHAGVNATWVYTLGSMVFFFVVFDAVVVGELTEQYLATESWIFGALIVAVLIATATQIRYCWFLRDQGLPSIWWTAALVAPALVSWALAFFTGEAAIIAATPLWLAASLVSLLLPTVRRWALLALAAAVTVLPAVAQGLPAAAWFSQDAGPRTWMLAIYCVSLPLLLMASVWWWRVVERLDDSRRVAGELAVTQERLRFAADLHDIQGHHLQVIALKAELAERLQGHDAAASAAQLAEIRGIAKEALEETRALVAGLREVALEDELENAREVLTLAGAACSLEIDDLELRAHPRVQRVLALCVREGTTNILRHSAATSAAITLRRGETSFDLVLSNNGASQNGPAAADGARGAGQPLGTLGSGLASLKRRIEEIGGTLVIAHDADQFTLRVCVPHTEMSGA